MNFTRSYSKNPKVGKTLVIFGENGCGKTRTAKAIYHWASRVALMLPLMPGEENMRLSVARYAHWPAVVDGFKKQEFSVVDELRDAELMVVDDIGAEHDPSGFGSEQLCLLLSRREFRWNVFTTNLPPSEWHTRLERRLASRLFRNAEHVDLSNVPDFSTI